MNAPVNSLTLQLVAPKYSNPHVATAPRTNVTPEDRRQRGFADYQPMLMDGYEKHRIDALNSDDLKQVALTGHWRELGDGRDYLSEQGLQYATSRIEKVERREALIEAGRLPMAAPISRLTRLPATGSADYEGL